ncbi:MAG: hypothetical protein SGJ27_17560 [Candidatus Melainabacteria bacterium]|nr:hypothetical protein [Candidatus Melainabacteria bacterium]
MERLESTDTNLPRYPVHILIVTGMALLSLLLVRVLAEPNFLNHDCAFLLHGARLLLDGRQPFNDFVDMVPPLAFYMFVPVWAITAVSGVGVALVWNLLCVAYTALTVVLGIIVVRPTGNMKRSDWLSIGPLFCGFLLFTIASMYHIGQREQLFVLAMWLMLLVRWQRSFANPVNRYIAIAAGIGLAVPCFIKPQFLLIVAVLEAYFWVLAFTRTPQERYSLKSAPEVVALIVTILVGFVLSLFIPNIGEYFFHWVPVVAQGYPVFNPDLGIVLSFAMPSGQMMGNRLLVPILSLLSLFMIRRSTLIFPLLLWTLAGCCVYLLQGKGWAYHALPMVAGYFMLASVTVANLVDVVWQAVAQRQKQLAALSALRQSVIVFLLFSGVFSSLSVFLMRDSMSSAAVFPTLNDLITRATKPRDNVMILTTNFIGAYPMLVHLDRRQSTRYMWCFPLPMYMFLKGDKTYAKWDKEIERFYSDIAEDIEKFKPTIIATESNGLWSIHRAMLETPAVRKALEHYEPVGLVNGYSVWKIKYPQPDEPAIDTSLIRSERGG